MEWRLLDQESALENTPILSDDRALEADNTPNRISEDIVKCLCSIFLRIGTSKDNLGESKTTNFLSTSAFNKCNKEKESYDPYGVSSDTESRDLGPCYV